MDSNKKENFVVQIEMDHLGLYVQDLEKTISWYNEYLGFRLSDYLPKGNKEEPVAPDGIAWMRYGKWHHDLTLIQVPDEAMKQNEDKLLSNLKEICFFANSKKSLEGIYDKLTSSQVISELKFDSSSETSEFLTQDPDKNKIKILHDPSVKKLKVENFFSQINSLSHVTIWSKNTDIARKWYQNNLDLKEKTGSKIESVKMTNAQGETKLIIDQTPEEWLNRSLSFNGRGTLQQIALKVKSEKKLLDSYDLLVKNEVEIVQSPRPQNWSSGTKFYFLDTDKIKIEIETGMKSVEDSYGSGYEIIKKLNLLH
ncbi:MAG: VOC family protein [Nitrospinota bacterium]|nr:VOC family protein [Nitrospinota bacterium]